MTKKEQEKFDKALNRKNVYSNMCKMLNFIYVLIKEEDQQEIWFQNLYSWYDINENNLLNNQDIDIYKEIKPWLNNNSNVYSGKMSKI